MTAFLPPRHSRYSFPLARRASALALALLAALVAATPARATETLALAIDDLTADAAMSGTDAPERPATQGPDLEAQAGPERQAGAVDITRGTERRWARDYFAIAAGAASVPSYSGSDDRVIIPGLFIRGRVHGYAFSSRGTNLQVDVIRQLRGQRVDWKLGPIINLRGERTGRIGDAQVAALGKRDLAVEAGLVAGVSASGIITSKYDNLGVRIVALRDISGEHGSWVVSPTIDYGTPLSRRAYVGLSASINITGRGYGRYYYDIDAAGSAASGLPQFSRAGARASVGKATLGLAAAYALSGDLRHGWVAVAGVQYGRLTGRLAQSPIVRNAGSRDQLLGGLGLAYQF